MATIRLEELHKTYPNGDPALRGIDLDVEHGEFLVLVGPSGCGKSTVLRLVAGLESPTRGRIWIGRHDVTDRSPRERDIAMVFQSYALYPHKSVRENLAFGLRMRSVERTEIQRRVEEVARGLGLGEVLGRRPAELSGGQRQRVALGRALVREPQAFLLDEPLSNLDAKLRVRTRAELARLHRSLRTTMLYVTHDQEEAMTLGDRIAVMCAGRLQQVGPPLEVYRQPATVFVADFIGSPAMNWFEGRLSAEGGGVRFRGDGFGIDLSEGVEAAQGGETLLGVRPQDVERVAASEADLTGRIEVVEPMGSTVLVHAGREAGPGFRALLAADSELSVGQPLPVRFPRDRLHFFDAKTGGRLGCVREEGGF